MAKSFTEIPVSTPETPTLDLVNEPKDLRDLNESQLETLADELREFLLFSVGQTGGHFGAGFGLFGMWDIKPIHIKSLRGAETKWIPCDKKEVYLDFQKGQRVNMILSE